MFITDELVRFLYGSFAVYVIYFDIFCACLYTLFLLDIMNPPQFARTYVFTFPLLYH